jgi:hypothetical protein
MLSQFLPGRLWKDKVGLGVEGRALRATCFDEAFRSEVVGVIRTPIQGPGATAIAERFVGAVRRE